MPLTRLRNQSAGIITSGTFADARIAASNVSQHAVTFDDDKIVNDLSTLGLRVHTQENLNASNTNSQYVDVFNDDSGFTNGANTSRNTNEYVSSIVGPSFASNDGTLSTNLRNCYNFNNSVADDKGNLNLYNEGASFDTSTKKMGTHSAYFDGGATAEFSFDNGSGGGGGVPYYHTNNSNGSYPPAALSASAWVYWTPNNGNWNMVLDGYDAGGQTQHQNYIFAIGNDNSSSNAHDQATVWDGLDQNWRKAADTGQDGGGTQITHSTWQHVVWTLTATKKQIFLNGSLNDEVTGTFGFGSSGTSEKVRVGGRAANGDYQFRGYLDQLAIWDRELTATDATNLYNSGNGNVFSPETASATGNFTCPNITAPTATTKMGAVITYQDQSGTNALNTDIILQLSADGGSNYSTATLTALPDFSTGIKMAKVNDLAVTSGTSLKYKILFANQATGSKEARIRGVSLNF